jgi:hypothetical protein
MRKSISPVIHAFLARRPAKASNTFTDGVSLFLFNNKIAYWHGDKLRISNAGWPTATTKDRLNCLPGVSILSKKGDWYLNGKPWGGGWITIQSNFKTYTECVRNLKQE